MTDTDIQCLKENVDKIVEIQTVDGELLVAKIISVFDQEDQPDIFYDVVSSNMIDCYSHLESGAGYSLDFDKILSVKPVANV